MKTYIGDGAYADFDGFGLILTTEDGIKILDKIYLEPKVYENLLAYVKSLHQTQEKNSYAE